MRRIYSNLIIREIPRLLSLMDRNPKSETYGCCDRNFWHYGSKCFPDARMQEAALTLALVWKNKYRNNPFYRQPIVRWCAEAAIKFWAKSQLKCGAFQEHFCFERSFPATVFSTAAIREACALLHIDDKKVLYAIVKAKMWIARHEEKLVGNQEAGAIYALWPGHSGRLEEFLARQNYCGWWSEYGGYDFGYSSVMLGYLCKLGQYGAAKRLVEFMARNTSCRMSRQTRFCLPYGLEVTARLSPTARWLADANLHYLKKYGLSYDDKYMACFGYNYLWAYDAFYKRRVENVPSLIVGRPEFLPVGKQSLPSPMKTLVHLPAQVLIGHSDFLSRAAKNYLRKKMITQRAGGDPYVPSRGFFIVDELEG